MARAVAFYTTHLGFTLEHQQLPAFASVSCGDANILLSGPQPSDHVPIMWRFKIRRPMIVVPR